MSSIRKTIAIKYRICSICIAIFLFIMQIEKAEGNREDIDHLQPTYPEDKKHIANLHEYDIDYNDRSIGDDWVSNLKATYPEDKKHIANLHEYDIDYDDRSIGGNPSTNKKQKKNKGGKGESQKPLPSFEKTFGKPGTSKGGKGDSGSGKKRKSSESKQKNIKKRKK